MNKVLMWILVIVGILVVFFGGFVAYEVYWIGTAVDKPAVYLYPQEDMQIQVKLDINGKIVKDIPKYGDGWDVFVSKDGLIENRYDYLFYENTLNELELPDEGWVVAQSDLYHWFDDNLAKLGLNEKEILQFKEYWLYQLTDSDYYEIKLLGNSFLEENMKLDISPKPDTVIRLIFNFKEVDEYYELEEPEIITPLRDGFVVVEWGGSLC